MTGLDRDSILKLLGAIAAGLYIAWLLRDALRTGVFRAPGAGRSADRDANPGAFWLAICLAFVAIVVAAWVALATLSGAPGR